MKINDYIYFAGCAIIGISLNMFFLPLFDSMIIGFLVIVLMLIPISVLWYLIVYGEFDDDTD